MIDREFYCDDCDQVFAESQSIHDRVRDKCPQCGAKTPTFNQLFGNPHVLILGEATTVGQQSERNVKRLGKELIQIQEEQELAKRQPIARNGRKIEKRSKTKERPFWRKDSDKPLDISKIPDLKKYIEHGTTK